MFSEQVTPTRRVLTNGAKGRRKEGHDPRRSLKCKVDTEIESPSVNLSPSGSLLLASVQTGRGRNH